MWSRDGKGQLVKIFLNYTGILIATSRFFDGAKWRRLTYRTMCLCVHLQSTLSKWTSSKVDTFKADINDWLVNAT